MVLRGEFNISIFKVRKIGPKGGFLGDKRDYLVLGTGNVGELSKWELGDFLLFYGEPYSTRKA